MASMPTDIRATATMARPPRLPMNIIIMAPEPIAIGTYISTPPSPPPRVSGTTGGSCRARSPPGISGGRCRAGRRNRVTLTWPPRCARRPRSRTLLCLLVRSQARSRALLAALVGRVRGRCCAYWFARKLAHGHSSLRSSAAFADAAVPIGSLASSLTQTGPPPGFGSPAIYGSGRPVGSVRPAISPGYPGSKTGELPAYRPPYWGHDDDPARCRRRRGVPADPARPRVADRARGAGARATGRPAADVPRPPRPGAEQRRSRARRVGAAAARRAAAGGGPQHRRARPVRRRQPVPAPARRPVAAGRLRRPRRRRGHRDRRAPGPVAAGADPALLPRAGRPGPGARAAAGPDHRPRRVGGGGRGRGGGAAPGRGGRRLACGR